MSRNCPGRPVHRGRRKPVDKELSVIGKKAGVTTLTIVKSDGSATQMYRIDVGNDAAAATIRQMVGNTNITVRAIGDALVLDGKVNDEIEAQRAVQIAGAYKAQVVNLLEVSSPAKSKSAAASRK